MGSAFVFVVCIAIDGDTLVCNHEKVRLTNVYAAELKQPGGAAAKRRLQALVGSGPVALKPLGYDAYGRTLAEVYVNGRRIEQADIGPRAGVGSHRSAERHHYYYRRAPWSGRAPRGVWPPSRLTSSSHSSLVSLRKKRPASGSPTNQ
jgi:Staphylococcal nuclease homologue